MKKIFITLFLFAQPLYIFAQASGGQISRKSSHKLTIHSHKKAKSCNFVIPNKVYPHCDEKFNGSEMVQARGALRYDYRGIDYYMLPTPDFNGHILERNPNRKQINLKQISCKPNDITDDANWYNENNIQSDSEKVEVPVYGLRERIKTGGYHVLLFGESYGDITKVIVTDEKETVLYGAYDFENFRKAPKIDKSDNYSSYHCIYDIVIEGSIMYVGHGDTFPSTHDKKIGYITTIDLCNNQILWTSLPMICNSEIAIVKNSLITGYGATYESDYVFVLDKYSGQTVQKISLKDAPEYIIVKGTSVFVRSYSYDYIFSIK